MTPQEREVMQMALDALELVDGYVMGKDEAKEALYEALAQPKQEPVAFWRHASSINQGWDEFGVTRAFDDDVPLYTAPPQREWQGLTDEDIEQIHYDIKCKGMGAYSTNDIYRAIEAKLREKNT